MEKLNNSRSKKFSLMGLICLLVPLSLFILWIYASGLGTTQAERVEIFQSYLPGFLHGRTSATYVSIILSVLAIILVKTGLEHPGVLWKILNVTILILSSLLLLLNLFSMM